MRVIGKIIQSLYWIIIYVSRSIYRSYGPRMVKNIMIELLYRVVRYNVFWIVTIFGLLGLHSWGTLCQDEKVLKEIICVWGYLWLKLVCCFGYIEYNRKKVLNLKNQI